MTKVTPQDHHAGALHHALLPLHGLRRPQASTPTPETFFADLARIYREEIADLAKAGCRYIQLDEVAVAMLCDPPSATRSRRAGQDPDRLVDLYIEAINDCVAGAPADMVIGVHMCRGNFRGRYLSEGGYEFGGRALLRQARKVTHFLLEYDTGRAGDFKPLRFVPKGKGVVLGLVSTKTPVLEIDRRSAAPHRRGRQVHRPRTGSASARSAALPPPPPAIR